MKNIALPTTAFLPMAIESKKRNTELQNIFRKRIMISLAVYESNVQSVSLLDLQKTYFQVFGVYLNKAEMRKFAVKGSIKDFVVNYLQSDIEMTIETDTQDKMCFRLLRPFKDILDDISKQKALKSAKSISIVNTALPTIPEEIQQEAEEIKDGGNSSSINGKEAKEISNDAFFDWLNQKITDYHRANQLTSTRQQKIERFVARLQTELRKGLKMDNLNIVIFGSVISGFANNDSDIDLCLTNTGICTPNILIKRKQLLNKTVSFLKQTAHFDQLFAVLCARTPIVKFKHLKYDVYGDISVENKLAICNTELLKAYNDFDKRVAPLGFAVKLLAKLFEINDASIGSISSYAYIVMLIYFLQRTEEPVLPFLQDTKSIETNVEVEGWKVLFIRDTFHCSNKTITAELFYDFLQFFAYKFDYANTVVQIRNKATCSKTNRHENWSRFCMCVEDPFDLSHNLTSGVNEDTLHYVRNCFHYVLLQFANFNGTLKTDGKLNLATQNECAVEGKKPELFNLTFDALLKEFKSRWMGCKRQQTSEFNINEGNEKKCADEANVEILTQKNGKINSQANQKEIFSQTTHEELQERRENVQLGKDERYFPVGSMFAWRYNQLFIRFSEHATQGRRFTVIVMSLPMNFVESGSKVIGNCLCATVLTYCSQDLCAKFKSLVAQINCTPKQESTFASYLHIGLTKEAVVDDAIWIANFFEGALMHCPPYPELVKTKADASHVGMTYY